jgi:hypothetical protein
MKRIHHTHYRIYWGFTALAVLCGCLWIGYVCGENVRQRRDEADCKTSVLNSFKTGQDSLHDQLQHSQEETSYWQGRSSGEQLGKNLALYELERLKAQRRLLEPFMHSGALIIQEQGATK